MSDGFHYADEAQVRAVDTGLLKRLAAYVRPYRRWMYGATALLLLAALLSNMTPLLIMWSVDYFINNPERTELRQAEDTAGPQLQALVESDMQGLLELTVLLALIVAGEAFIRYVQLVIVGWVGQKTMMEMRIALFEHLQRLSIRYLDRHPVGRLLTRVTNDIEKIQQTIVAGMVQVASDLFTIVVVLVVMVVLNPVLTLIALLPMPGIILVTLLFRKYAQHSFLEIRKKIARLNAFLQESISGMRIVQLFGREEAQFAQYDARNASHRNEWFRQIRNFALYMPAVDFLSTLTTAFIILYCGLAILALGHEKTGHASVGTMFAFVFLAERCYGPIRALADRYNLLLEAMAASERVFQLLDVPEEIENCPNADPAESLIGRICFDQVWFSYEEDEHSSAPRWVLKDISVSIEPGERVAIVGHTGAGKSTFINLLSRFYDVQRGAIKVDGRDVRDYDKVGLRRNIGVVLQDVFLFNGTIEDNIRLGDEGMSDAWVCECAAHVNAARFIERLPGGYRYAVGERGCNLSTGQRQLLAFARTLAHSPRILVLDEATSSVDTETEVFIQDAIAKLMAGRTSIVIAHRLSTVQHADRILVMHHGEIREEGTHQALLARGGLYRTLYELQYKDQEIGGR